jgi:hypothetical protein
VPGSSARERLATLDPEQLAEWLAFVSKAAWDVIEDGGIGGFGCAALLDTRGLESGSLATVRSGSIRPVKCRIRSSREPSTG